MVDAPDPFELVASDLGGLSDGIKSLIGTDHPVLNAAAKYFFELDGGKKIRPTMVSHGLVSSVMLPTLLFLIVYSTAV